jgi:cytoskeletal protein RodZ
MISKIMSRKTLRDYAIPILATIVFVILFIALWIAHQYALASVGNLAQTNPLIVSDANKLVSRDKSDDPEISQPDDTKNSDETSSGSPTSNPDSTNSDHQASSTPNTGQPANNTTSPSSGGGNTTPSTPQAPQFAISVGSMQYSRTTSNLVTGLLGLLLGCTIDHQFKVAVNAANGPGTIKYQWIRSTGGGGDVEQKNFTAGNSSIDLVHSWRTSSSGDYWVNLQISSPIATERKFTFKHQC